MNYLVFVSGRFKCLSLALMCLCFAVYSNYSKAEDVSDSLSGVAIAIQGSGGAGVLTRQSSKVGDGVWYRVVKGNHEGQKWDIKLVDRKEGAFKIKPEGEPGKCLDYKESSYNVQFATKKYWLTVENCVADRTNQQWIVQPTTTGAAYALRPVENPELCVARLKGQDSPGLVEKCKSYSDDNEERKDRWQFEKPESFALEVDSDPFGTVLRQWADLSALWMYGAKKPQITDATKEGDETVEDSHTGSTGQLYMMRMGKNNYQSWCQNGGETDMTNTPCWTGSDSTANMSSYTYGFGEKGTVTIGTGDKLPIKAMFEITFESNQSWTNQKTSTDLITIALPVKAGTTGWLAQGTTGNRYTAKYKFTTDLQEKWISNVITATVTTPDSSGGLSVCNSAVKYDPGTPCAVSRPNDMPADKLPDSAQASAPASENPFK